MTSRAVPTPFTAIAVSADTHVSAGGAVGDRLIDAAVRGATVHGARVSVVAILAHAIWGDAKARALLDLQIMTNRPVRPGLAALAAQVRATDAVAAESSFIGTGSTVRYGVVYAAL